MAKTKAARTVPGNGKVGQVQAAPAGDLDLKALFRALLLPRVIEEKQLRLIRQGRLSKWFSGYGQEAVAVGCAWALEPGDDILPMHRNLGVWTTRGVPLRPLFCQLMGRAGGFTKGRDRTFHFGLPSHHLYGMISHLAAMLPVACGLGLAARLDGRPNVALAFVGDGATREGDFHEALNLAAVWKLPVLFVVENNAYGLSTPVQEAVAVEDIADAAAGYGMPGVVVDGNDVLAVIAAVRQAAERARHGEGPTLLEMKTFRIRGHEEASGTKYVPPELIAAWAKKDPVERFTRYVLERGVMTEAEVEAVRAELEAEVDAVAEWALAQPPVESTPEAERADVFAPAFEAFVPPAGSSSEKRFIDAISEALAQAMERDERVILMGQDIAEYGGVFKVTAGFVERFGKARVRNTPIIESGAVGAAMGLALAGYRPVVEMQYADFISCGFNQIVNNLATTHYRWGAPVNVTIRAPFGGYIGAGPFHSQSMEAWFCHVPGLKVVVPATPQDAKGLLLTAIEEPNPVLFFEHKYLYRSLRGDVTEAPFHLPFGEARVVREGTHATVVTYGLGVHWALEEAEHWAGQGVELEVIDLRTLVPWDRETVLRSVAKTNRVLVLHEAPLTAGFGAEIAARIAEEAFEHLDAPVLRVGAEDLPVPFSPSLEREIYAARVRLRPALERLLAY
ncbi:dehydrogenase E1 component subunit alpha/beta [Rhodocaloribacter litoris]|uniref:alpha-ketoacid dehydrogenase subunit alpha/beta n=1 Tax=Rhodocaloribacter litoris TaxID=2558931 RepID=UPI00142060CA|nr:dehydrogenase E1 component subunit alpha/beta [Rhodocaloribacter litoris]QXD15276.1 dehydrogenase E1 component subunit alpha/beta [Rhodocaloribacter litoris]